MEANSGRGFWNRLKANWYRRGLDYSTFADVALSVILPRAEDSKTFLDVGAGCGTLSMPLARAGKKVTAVEPSAAMTEILKEDIAKEGLGNITTVAAFWQDARDKTRPHDAIVCANVPDLLKEPEGFLLDAQRLAKKKVFLIENAGPKSDKFYYRELYPLLFGRPFGERTDYLKTYSALHAMGIFAGVEVIDYDFDQPFDDIDEAVEFWKEYLGIVTEEHDGKLRDFLKKKLERKKGVLLARFKKQSAVIWWDNAKLLKEKRRK